MKPCTCVNKAKLLFLLLFAPSIFACTVTDDAGNQLRFPRPAQRIITLAPDLTEQVFALGAAPALVGVLAGSDYPAAAKKIPRVGDYRALDLETLVALKPGLVLAWGESQPRQVAALKRFSIPVFISHPRHLADIPRTLRRLGCLTGQAEAAEQAALEFEHRLAFLKKKYHRDRAPRVFYELSSQPLFTINQGSWINDAIQVCGGKNVFAETGLSPAFKKTAFAVTAEAVVQANPQWVVADLPPGWEEQWQHWPSVTAVRERHLFTINPDLLDRAGPRILDGVEDLCKIISADHAIMKALA